MRVTVTGATGLIGPRVVASLRARGDDVTVLSRNPRQAREKLERSTQSPATPSDPADSPSGSATAQNDSAGTLDAQRWDPSREPAPTAALAGRDAVVHLAGENIAQRWSTDAKQAIRESRVTGTRQLVQGLGALGTGEQPRVLVSGSAIGYYGAHGDEPIDEEAPAGGDFLAQTCSAWEAEAEAAEQHGLRVVRVRTGVVLDRDGGALAKMLPPFKLGVGGPVAGGLQYISWVHPEDLVEIVLAAIDSEQWRGPINATAPEPQRNRDFSKALGAALHRPALLPVPGAALKLLYGEMSEIVTTGARVLPAKALVLGYEFRYPRLDSALRAALG
ncbi:MAG TPA: TIGR01777 family oxidoreductase [Solirubrobacteraceae bacterium]